MGVIQVFQGLYSSYITFLHFPLSVPLRRDECDPWAHLMREHSPGPHPPIRPALSAPVLR